MQNIILKVVALYALDSAIWNKFGDVYVQIVCLCDVNVS